MPTSKEVYPVEVDYSIGFDQILQQAQFDYINSGVTPEHFRLKVEP